MSTGAGWHQDPTGRAQLRWWDGEAWTSWASTGGQVAHDPVPQPPPTGGATLTSEPVVLARRGAPGTWALTTLYGVALAGATWAADGTFALHPAGGGEASHTLRLTRAGTTAVVVLADAAGGEVGRFEEVRRAYLGGFRVVGAGALLATLDAESNDLRRLVLVDPGGRPIGRVATDHGGWTTELAHPLGPPLGMLAAVAALAAELAWS